jgi:mycothiol synthase
MSHSATRAVGRIIRPVELADYEWLAEINNLCWPEDPMDASELQELDEAPRRQTLRRRYVCVEDEQVVGSGNYHQLEGRHHPARFWLEIDIHPDYRGRGHGGALMALLLVEVERLGGLTARVALRDDRSVSRAFLEKRGFVLEWEATEKEFDLSKASFDVEAARRHLADQGLRVDSLAEIVGDSEMMRRLYEVHEEARKDTAFNDPVTAWGYENFEQSVMKELNRGASFVALDGEVPVGLAFLSNVVHDGIADHRMTCVAPSYRGRGVALGLKTLLMDRAKAAGHRAVWTTSNSANQRMLEINDRFGFKTVFSWQYFAKPLGVDVPGLVVRQVRPEDWDAVAELRNRRLTEKYTGDFLREREQTATDKDNRQSLVALIGEEVVGFAGVVHHSGMPATTYTAGLNAEDEQILRHLMAQNEAFIRSRGGDTSVMFERDDCPDRVALLGSLGFELRQHLIESLLDLEKTKHLVEPFCELRIASFAEIGDTPGSRQRLHALYCECEQATPGCELWGVPTYEAFERDMFGHSRHEPEAIFVALDGGEFVGITFASRTDDEAYGWVFSGVREAYRGRGLGYALKYRLVRHAQAQGAKWLRSQNDARNGPMLHINEKLGFERQFGWLHLAKRL